MSCQEPQYVQTFRILSCRNAQTIVASSASCKKCAAISYRMPVIVTQQSSLRRVGTYHTVSSNFVLDHPLHSSFCMFILPS